jgi:hypothetical protein
MGVFVENIWIENHFLGFLLNENNPFDYSFFSFFFKKLKN